VKKNDVVAALLPNVPEAIIFMLATTAMGAIWTSCSPDFGVPAILDRFSQVEPKALITAPGYLHKGKWIDCRDKNQTLISALPTLLQTHSIDQSLDQNQDKVYFESLPFDHPGFILYSSGTTGKPKCIVHGQGGTLIQHMKELILHTDLKPGDRLLYLTTCGWMMWNWMASALGTGAAVVLFEGNPFFPQSDSLFSILSEAQVTVFGTSAKFLSTWQKAGVTSSHSDAFKNIHTVLSTGSPLLPDTFKYVYTSLKEDLCLSSISGGTDIISCFALGCPLLPVYAGELQCRGLGMAVEVWNEEGESVIEEKGELVCIKAFPSMPLKFWNDPDGKKFHQAYFNRFEGVWTHGDYAMLKSNGGLVIFGRSDSVLNPGGVRIGTAEIYRQVETLPSVQESLAVGLDQDGNQVIILFVILAPGQTLSESLKDEIKLRLRQNASPRHVPAQIIEVKDFPRTVNGKVSEIAVTKIINHQPLDNLDALANPEVLDLFRELRL
jgi:acetoacetyl-CoA synthetase